MILYFTQECFICAECNGKYIGEDEFGAHTKEKHTYLQNVLRIREFDWALLHTRDGHYEMNLQKSFFELNWDIFLKQVAQKMRWVSEMALKSAKSVMIITRHGRCFRFSITEF